MLMPFASLLFATNDNASEVYADSSMDQNQSQTLSLDSLGTHNLYDENSKDNTSSYYYLNIEKPSRWSISGEKEILTDNICVKVNHTTNINSSAKITVSTTFTISDSLLLAMKNGKLALELKSKMTAAEERTSTMTLTNGSRSQSVSTTNTDGEYLYAKLDEEKSDDWTNTFTATFTSEGKSISILQPQIIISTTDQTAPIINTSTSKDTNKTSEKRTINFSVNDKNGSGIKYVEYNGKREENVADGTEFAFDALYSQDYTIRVCDNVGNEDTYTVLKDDVKPNNPSFDGAISISNRNKTLQFKLLFDESTIAHHSDETLYYLIMTSGEYSQISSDNLANIVLEHSMGTCEAGTTNLSLGNYDLPMDDYKILVVARDMAGNVCEKVAVEGFSYNPTGYTLAFPALKGGKYTSVVIDGYDYLTSFEENDDNYLTIYADEEYQVKYQANDGYQFYGVQIDNNGINNNVNYSSEYTKKFNKETSFDVKFRYIVDLDIANNLEFDHKSNEVLNELLASISIAGDGELYDYLMTNFANRDGDDVVINKDIIEFSLYDESNNLIYNSTSGKVSDDFYNVGNYYLRWSVVNNYKDWFVAKTNNDIQIVISPKSITGMSYTDCDNLIYDPNGHQIAIDFANTNLALEEIESLKDLFAINYYLDTDLETSLDKMTIVGTYLARVSINHDNYIISDTCNEITDIRISKKCIALSEEQTTFKYNEEVQSIEFSVIDDILSTFDFNISYTQNDESVDFKNVGSYVYSIALKDEFANNYCFEGDTAFVTGNCIITQKDVCVTLNQEIYDYTGKTIVIDYVVKDATGEVITSNVFGYTVDGDNMCEVGEYSISFVCDDDGYILHCKDNYSISIRITKLRIVIVKEYEYNGSAQTFRYTLMNEYNEEISEVAGVSVNIFKDGESIDDFTQVYTYTYKFDIDNKFVILSVNGVELDEDDGELSGEFSVVPAIINVNIKDVYEYLPNPDNVSNLENYSIEYSLISKYNVDFKLFNFVSLSFTKLDDEGLWGDVGRYGYTFVSSDGSVVFQNGESTTATFAGYLNINPRKITANVKSEYVYANENIIIEYTINNYYGLESDSIELTYDTIKAVGDYTYSISCNNSNYEMVIVGKKGDDGYFVSVIPAEVTIESIVCEYEYTADEISVDLEIANPLGENVSYTISAKQNGESVSIKNAGSYQLSIISNDNNYVIVYDEIIIIVSPKHLDVVIDEDSLVVDYTGEEHNVIYSFQDSLSQNVLVEGKVEYDGDNLPINAGVYDFEILLSNTNYVIDQIKGQLIINKIHLNVWAVSGQNKIYGKSDPVAIDYSFSGNIDGDEIVLSLARESGEDVGFYAISYVENSLQNQNYIVDFKQEPEYFEILAKKIIVIADNKAKTFGDEDCELTYKILMDGALTTTLLGNDKLSGTLIRQAGENVDVYDIEKGTLNNDNYSIDFEKGEFTIIARDLHITIDNKTQVYGEIEFLTYSSEESFDKSYITGELTRTSGETVGDYDITIGTLASQNYNLIVINENGKGVYSITPRKIQVIAHKSSKIYGQVDTMEYDVLGLINGDTLSGELSRESGEDVGDYAILLGTLGNANYDIEFTSNILTIQKDGLNIVFDDKSQVYGESEVALTYSIARISGLQFEDTLDILAMRDGGNDVGEYRIGGSFVVPSNYYINEIVPGKYTITKASVKPVLLSKTVVYNGKPQTLQVTNFEDGITFVYTSNGFEVEECVKAGKYIVYAIFEGNQNYEYAESKKAELIIEKQNVFISITADHFVYDGDKKYPEFSYDKNIGVDESSFSYRFENNITPQEVGDYNFTITINDDNYTGSVQGVVKIQKTLSVVNEQLSIVECNEATFDEESQNIKLVQNLDTKKFNDEKVLSVCTLENASKKGSDYVYTVKIKATEGVDNVKVYKVGLSGFSQQAIKIENGYYVFKIDDINDKYIITTEEKTLSTLAWILILVVVVLIFTIALMIVLRKKHKKAKADKKSKVSDIDIETYNIN